MAFEIDFNTSSADQRVESLTSKLTAMSQAAIKASASLTPTSKSIQAIKQVADAHTEITKSLDKVIKVSEDASKKIKAETESTSNGVKKFFNALDSSITKNSHTINAWSGTYGTATQDMMRSNQELKKQANALARAQEDSQQRLASQMYKIAQQETKIQKEEMTKRTRDWTEYYKGQEKQVNRYTTFLKKSQDVWAKSSSDKLQQLADKRRQIASQMFKVAEQETRFEKQASQERTRVWSEYYNKQDAQIARYKKSLTQSRVIVARHTKNINSNSKAITNNTQSLMHANQATASFRAGMTALGTSFGIYTSGTFAVAAGTYAIVSAMQNAVLTGVAFEKSMYRVYAVTGQMGSTYEKDGNLMVSTSEKIASSQKSLSDAAVEASKVTIFTAVEAAEGLVALGMAGLNAEQSIGALTPSLQLAQIGMIDVYESADIMTNVMLGFGMSIKTTEESLKNATLVTDVLAAAITNSNSTIKEMAKALSYVAPIAHAAGASIQETVAALETFHNVGIKGQRAGTSLRRAYVNLLEPTDKVASKLRDMEVSVREADGSMRSLTDIMVDLQDTGATVADLVTIFGVRAAPAMVAFMENLKAIQVETKRLTEETDGAGKAMADFMATSTSGQWQIIQSKIQAQFVEAFAEAEPAIKQVNLALMNLVDNNLDDMFTAMGEGIKTAAEWMETFAVWTGHAADNWSAISTNIQIPLRPDKALTNVINLYKDLFGSEQKKLPDFMMPQVQVPMMPKSDKGGWGGMDYSSIIKQNEDVNEELKSGVLLTTEQVQEQVQREASSQRLVEFARLENAILSDNSMKSEATSAKREMAMSIEVAKYQEKLGLITQESALNKQIAAVDTARIAINSKFVEENNKIKEQLQKIRDVNTGTAADSKKYGELLRKQAELNQQLIGQTEQLNQEAGKLTLTMQEAAMKDQGFGKLTTQVDNFAVKLENANAKLRGNKQAAEENSVAQFQNAIARREVYQATDAFLMLSDLQQQAFKKETDAIKGQLPYLQQLVTENKKLTDAKAADAKAKKAEKETEKLVGQFGKGKGLGPEGKGAAKYSDELKRYQEYEDNKFAIMQEYGFTELEFQNMMVEAKLESEQRYWDSQHENLAKWRDTWATSVADNVEQALFMEQSWSEAAQNISRTMLGTIVNTMVKIGAEMVANYAMKQMFSSGEMAMDAAVTTSKVAGEAAKTTAVTTTAAAEAAAGAGALSYFTSMLTLGPALAAAWGPAAMYINIASFGAAGMAAAGSALMAGAATAAAGIVAGAGGAAGEAISGSRQFGGDVVGGNSYLVGESGREIFTPDTSGSITSNQNAMGSSSSGRGGDTYITYDNTYQIDATGNEDIEDRLIEAVEEASNRGHQKVINDFASNGDAAKLARRNARA